MKNSTYPVNDWVAQLNEELRCEIGFTFDLECAHEAKAALMLVQENEGAEHDRYARLKRLLRRCESEAERP